MMPIRPPVFRTRLPAAVRRLGVVLPLAMGLLGSPVWSQTAAPTAAPVPGDHIVAVVNSELVTAFEVQQRLVQAREDAGRSGARLPAPEVLAKQVLDSLIDERVIITYARDSGVRVDEPDIDRAVAAVASQNRLTLEQLRERLRTEGLDFTRFRANLRDQLLVERVREREVSARIAISDAEVDAFVDERRAKAGGEAQYNIAQILIPVPENADEAEVNQRRARAEQALARVRGGEDFEAVAREVSQDVNRERGGVIGLRTADRLPTLFVDAVKPLAPGGLTPAPLRSGAGFHVLKLIERVQPNPFQVSQTRVRHILLRPSAQLSAEAAVRRLTDLKRDIEAGSRRFEDAARELSEDGSASRGGDLGWASPGGFVPEFEEAMNRLPPGGLSAPVTTRFGVHLIQVLERKNTEMQTVQLREQARAALRERKFETAYQEWARELRAQAFVELRDAPL